MKRRRIYRRERNKGDEEENLKRRKREALGSRGRGRDGEQIIGIRII